MQWCVGLLKERKVITKAKTKTPTLRGQMTLDSRHVDVAREVVATAHFAAHRPVLIAATFVLTMNDEVVTRHFDLENDNFNSVSVNLNH